LLNLLLPIPILDGGQLCTIVELIRDSGLDDALFAPAGPV